jgi:hypothetical protein
LEKAFPFRGIVVPREMQFCQVGPVANAILGRGPQVWFNSQSKGIQPNAQKKAGVIALKQELFGAFGNIPNGENPPAMGTIAITSGNTFSQAWGCGGPHCRDQKPGKVRYSFASSSSFRLRPSRYTWAGVR